MSRTLGVFLTLIAVLVPLDELAAQRANNIWYFGDSAAIDFNVSPPASRTDSRMSAPEGCASVADRRTGDLLFYTNGEKIWNRLHQIMMNGDSLEGHRSSLQSSVIVPDPSDDLRYFVFTTDAVETGFRFGLQYSIVDMRGDGGNGRVVSRNRRIIAPVGERLCAVRSCAGDRYWVLTYIGDSHQFVAVSVTAAGVGAPVISNMGETEFALGEIKASNSGELLATSVKLSQSWDAGWAVRIYRLDQVRGTVSIVTTVGDASGDSYAFSPNDSLLYVTGPGLLQYDLSVLDSAAITSSRTTVFESVDATLQGVQLGPDGRIYISVRSQAFVGVVEAPNVRGTACSFALEGLSLARGKCRSRLPNVINALSISDAEAGVDQVICRGDSVRLRGSGAARATWSPSASLSCDTCAEPIAFPTVTTTYWLTALDGRGCLSTDSVVVRVVDRPSAGAGKDVGICAGDSAVLNATGGSTFQWRPATGLSCADCPSPTARPVQTTTYIVRAFTDSGCWDEDSVTVSVASRPAAFAGNDTSICTGSTITLQGSEGVRWQWSPAAGLSCADCRSPSAIIDSTIEYRVVVTNAAGCTASDTIVVVAIIPPTLDVSGDTVVCPGSAVMIRASGALQYRWEPREGLSCSDCADPTVTPFSTTTYRVFGTNAAGCTAVDSIVVSVMEAARVRIVGDSIICRSGAVELRAVGSEMYRWRSSTGDLQCDTCSRQIVSPEETTTYYVEGRTSAGCTTVDSLTVWVVAAPELAVTDTVVICSGSKSALRASGASAYVWSPTEGLSCTDCAEPIASPDSSTTYRVIGLIGGVCSDTAFVTVVVVDEVLVRASLPRELGMVAGEPTRVAVSLDGTISADSVHVELEWYDRMVRVDEVALPDALTTAGWRIARRVAERDHLQVTLFNTIVSAIGAGELLIMNVTTYLSDSVTSEIALRVTASDSCVRIASRDGSVRLDSLCGLHMRLIDISTNGLQLYAPVPNPTSAYVRIPFEVPFDGIVEVVMADVTGMSTFELLSGEARGGRHELLLDATALVTGAYEVRLRFGGIERRQRFLVVH